MSKAGSFHGLVCGLIGIGCSRLAVSVCWWKKVEDAAAMMNQGGHTVSEVDHSSTQVHRFFFFFLLHRICFLLIVVLLFLCKFNGSLILLVINPAAIVNLLDGGVCFLDSVLLTTICYAY